jgi:glycosyltransferase involved in cell wall biosynthesis
VGFPYVLGPAGGAEQASPAFWRQLGVGGALLECLRWLSNRLMAADPLVRRTWRRAALILASSDDSAYFLEGHRANPNIAVEPSIAVDDAMLAEPMGPAEAEGTGPQTDVGSLRILCVGRLVGWKGIHLAVEAAAAAHDRGVLLSLTILGRGPQAGRLLELAHRLGLGERLTIIPALPTLDDVAALYREHDLLIFPSLHDSGGMAVVEAMAAGIPVVCLGIGGPALSVTSESGFVIEARSPDRSVSAMVDAICLLASDADLGRQMGAAGRQRVIDSYTWASRARAVERHLRSVTESSRLQ